MPYIPKDRREWLEGNKAEVASDFAYLLYSYAMQDFRNSKKKFADRIRALDNIKETIWYGLNKEEERELRRGRLSAAREFERRYLDPYEEEAIERNGDIL